MLVALRHMLDAARLNLQDLVPVGRLPSLYRCHYVYSPRYTSV